MQPILANYATPPQKGLAIPMPHDPSRAAMVKAFWLDLISTFLPRAEFEISIFSWQYDGIPTLTVTFNGATPATYCALFSDQVAEQLVIDTTDSVWVDDCVSQDPGGLKLSSYLEHESLTLRQLVDTFRQTFSG
jgi:type VI secretion system protein ImpM